MNRGGRTSSAGVVARESHRRFPFMRSQRGKQFIVVPSPCEPVSVRVAGEGIPRRLVRAEEKNTLPSE